MKKFLLLAFMFLGAGLAHGQGCSPPAYNCFNNTTSAVNYPSPLPSWGLNNCDPFGTATIYTMAQCGNLTGAGTTVSPSDFGTTLVRCTDVNTDTTYNISKPQTIWQTTDDPSVNLWNTDDTAMLLLVNGGGVFVFLWDGTSCQILTGPAPTYTRVQFPAGTVWSRSARDHIYTLDNSTGPGIYLKDNHLNLTQGSGGIISSAQLFDYAGTNCLANSKNGTGAAPDTFPLTEWTGTLSSQDGQSFAVPFSLLKGQGSGYFYTIFTIGQNGCDIWNTLTGDVTHTDGTPAVTTDLGNIPDNQYNGPLCPGGSCGGQADRFKIHDGVMANPTNVTLSATQSGGLPYGTYTVSNYFWPKGSNNVQQCGIGAPNWKANNTYNGTGDRILPTGTFGATNTAGYMYQIINHTGGTSGAAPPTWNQTPGSDTGDNGLTWRNIGIGSTINDSHGNPTTFNCDGHTWKGFIGTAAGKNYTYHYYTQPNAPLLQLGPQNPPGTFITSPGDQHFGNTNGNSTDTNWIWVASSNVGTNVDLAHGVLPGALYGEGFFVGPPYCSPGVLNGSGSCSPSTFGQVRRAFHAFNTGWSPSFDTRYGMSVVSQTGNYAMIPSDMFGQVGSQAGKAKCNIGGPDWDNQDSGAVTWQVGQITFPYLNQNNPANNLYQVKSCSGACAIGTTHPTWPQGKTVASIGTFTDGTITWEGVPDINDPSQLAEATADCRSDVLVAKLNRSAGGFTQNTVIQGNTKIQGNVKIN
jgi:hypothetical protein